jgi:hypothetical protein
MSYIYIQYYSTAVAKLLLHCTAAPMQLVTLLLVVERVRPQFTTLIIIWHMQNASL